MKTRNLDIRLSELDEHQLRTYAYRGLRAEEAEEDLRERTKHAVKVAAGLTLAAASAVFLSLTLIAAVVPDSGWEAWRVGALGFAIVLGLSAVVSAIFVPLYALDI